MSKQGAPNHPEALNTTDPQEHMRGPVSSVMQSIKEEVEENDEEAGQEAREAAKGGDAR